MAPEIEGLSGPDASSPPPRPSTTDVTRIKAAVRERDGMKCTRCGMTNERHVEVYGVSLEVHRKSPGSPYTFDGCVTLCNECHHREPKSPRGRGPTWVIRDFPPPVRAAVHAYAGMYGINVSQALEIIIRYAIPEWCDLADERHPG